MISIDFTSEEIDALHFERFNHPHPRVQLKMEAVYLKTALSTIFLRPIIQNAWNSGGPGH